MFPSVAGVATVDTSRRARLAHHELGEAWQARFQPPPYPSSKELTCWVGETIDFVQVSVIQLCDDWFHHTGDIREVRYPTRFQTDIALDVDGDVIRVPMKAFTLVPDGGVREPMSCLECEHLEYLHLRDPDVLVRLKTQPPARILEAVLDCERGVIRAGCPVHRLQEEVIEVEVFEVARVKSVLRVDQL